MSNNTSLINRTRVKRRCLEIANELYDTLATGPDTRTDSEGRTWTYTRARQARVKGRFTQVSHSLLDEIDTELRRMIYARVQQHKQTGKTVK
jgi:hypothetical protein